MPDPTADNGPADEPDFEGHAERECGEHRTTGGRAWCFDCSAWCFPDEPCLGCELPALRADRDRLATELADTRREVMIQADRAAEALDSLDIQRRLANAVIADFAAYKLDHPAEVKRLQDTINELTAELAAAPVPVSDQPEPTRNLLHEGCGQWHDGTGQQLVGWEASDGSGKRHMLPKGHMLPDYHIDAATGWEPIYGYCPEAVPDRPDTPTATDEES